MVTLQLVHNIYQYRVDTNIWNPKVDGKNASTETTGLIIVIIIIVIKYKVRNEVVLPCFL